MSMRTTPTYTLLAAAMVMVVCCLTSCVKDDLWREHYSRAYTAGEHISVSADSMATVAAAAAVRGDADEPFITPMPGYLTIVSSRYYSNDRGHIIYKERAGVEAMHNVRVNVRVVEGDPAYIQTLACTIGGLASRFDIARTQLLGPSARVTDAVAMQGSTGSALFRLLGSAADRQPLMLSLTQTDGRQQVVEVDVTSVLHQLRPQPFELSIDSSVSTDVHVEIETTVDIDIEIRLPNPSDTEAVMTAALKGWQVNEQDVNAY